MAAAESVSVGTNALTTRPRRRAPVWISLFNTCTAAVALWFYALPSGVWFAVLYALPAVIIWIAVLAFIALAVLTRTARAARSG